MIQAFPCVHAEAAKQFFEFVVAWLKEHIMGEDVKLASFLRQRRAA